jgi:hypothetical protein
MMQDIPALHDDAHGSTKVRNKVFPEISPELARVNMQMATDGSTLVAGVDFNIICRVH